MCEACSSIFLSSFATLRFPCSGRSGRGGGLGPRSDGGPVVTWSGGGTFLQQPRRTGEVHRSARVLQWGGGEVCGGKTIWINTAGLIGSEREDRAIRPQRRSRRGAVDTGAGDLQLRAQFRMSRGSWAGRGGGCWCCSAHPDAS